MSHRFIRAGAICIFSFMRKQRHSRVWRLFLIRIHDDGINWSIPLRELIRNSIMKSEAECRYQRISRHGSSNHRLIISDNHFTVYRSILIAEVSALWTKLRLISQSRGKTHESNSEMSSERTCCDRSPTFGINSCYSIVSCFRSRIKLVTCNSALEDERIRGKSITERQRRERWFEIHE
jgi:hypothetical protein